MYFLEYNKAVLKNPNALLDWLYDWFEMNDEKYVEFQKNQLNQGKNKEGKIIGLYAESTEKRTKGKKKANTPYNFQDTGEFFRSMVLLFWENGNTDFTTLLSSEDEKNELIIDKYDPFGLLDSTEKDIAKELSKFIKEKIENYGV